VQKHPVENQAEYITKALGEILPIRENLASFLKRFRGKSTTMASRQASHTGSWYSNRKSELSSQLDGWLEAVPAKTECIGTESSKDAPVDIPHSGARAIIAP